MSIYNNFFLNRSFRSCNFGFKKMKILLEIDRNTKILKTETKRRGINFGSKIFEVVGDSRDLHTNIVFALFDKAANDMAIMSWLLRETDHQ